MTNSKIRTKTSSFGTSKREGHDSSKFYARKLYSKPSPGKILYIENAIPDTVVDTIHCGDSRKMSAIPDSSVHLMVTSPPYNVGKDYDEDITLDDYRKLLKQVFQETFKKLVTGGRACINVANLGRSPYIPLHTYIIQDMLDIGYLMRGEIIWDKGPGAGVSCAWGSFASASNPTLRDTHEYILIFSKECYGRDRKDRENTISKSDFLDWTKSIWRFAPESARKVHHPAPFPIELPSRLIQFYTFKNDIVLDPFCGVGTTCVAALQTSRHFIGYDISEEYIKTASTRIANCKAELEARRAQISLPIV